tara:strand:+ start:6446 stop:6784 length:339 start_codon:yes stop_codon:yes gene_type:complete
MFKVNGFQIALEENTKRREEIKIEKESKVEVKKPKEPGRLAIAFKCTAEWWKKHWGSRVQKVKGQKVKVMGGFGVLWEMVKAIKTKNCPLLRFVDEQELAGASGPKPTEKME